jgi:hypothetical protein
METTQQFPELRSERRSKLFRGEERYVPFLENFTRLSPLPGADEAISHFARGGQARCRTATATEFPVYWEYKLYR